MKRHFSTMHGKQQEENNPRELWDLEKASTFLVMSSSLLNQILSILCPAHIMATLSLPPGE